MRNDQRCSWIYETLVGGLLMVDHVMNAFSNTLPFVDGGDWLPI